MLLSLPAGAQSLTISNDVQTQATLANTTVTMTGRAELRITGTGDPIPGCTIHLNAPDAWLIFTVIQPSTVRDTFLSRVRVNSAAAALDGNVRIVQFGMGAVVIPHAPSFQPLEVFHERYFRGTTRKLNQYTAYNTAALGTTAAQISSFKLKRGYMATFATDDNGVGGSRCYVAQDGDIEIGRLPAALDHTIRYVRVFPWRWVSKKGIAGNIAGAVKAHWWYNWNLDQNSPLDREYAAIRQTRWWPGMDQNWKTRGISHVLGYNEPDHADQANLSVAEAISFWPDVLWPGLRAGSPAPTDGGLGGWLYPFVDQADAAGLRVDYVAVHYYRSFADNNNEAGVANQFYNFLRGVYDRTKRPVWITEWNNGANWTPHADPTEAQQADAVEAMITMLDDAPFVERYALYNWVEDSRRLVWDDGSLRAAGVIYRDKVSPVGYRQERRDSGISRTTRYRLDGSSADSGGSGQDAIVVGTPSFAAGKYGEAILLDGANDYLQLPANVGNSTDFTFAAWVWWSGGGNWQRLFDLGDLPNYNLFLTAKAGSGAGTRFVMANGGGEQRLDAATFPVNAWTHVAVTIAGDTGKLFINGALVDTNTAMTINPADVGVKYNYLGHSRHAADPNFNGRFDDVRFLSAALSDARVAALYAAAPPSFDSSALTVAEAYVYRPYNAPLAGLVTGGTGTLTFEKLDGPAWLRVATNGALTGTPGAADAGAGRFMVRVTDAAGGTHMAELVISVLNPTAPVPVTISASIASSSNDAEEAADGTVSLTSTDLEMTDDTAGGAGGQSVGLRFNIQVPPGALISEARIQFTADEDQSGSADLTIATEAADTAAAFTTAAGGLSARARHAVTILWQPAAWNAGSAGAAQQTPNLAGLVQPVVSRPGWQMGNALAFLITGAGHRTAEAWDKSGGTPARLTITYYTPSPLYNTTVAISSSAGDAEQSAAGVMSLDSTDLELVADGALGNQTVGLRFTPLAIPRDALISNAAIQFAADEAQSAATALTIRAHAADNAAAFTTTANDFTSRARTTASVAWSPAAWATVDERGLLQRTPDISSVVQDIVSRPGWASGNALAVLINGTGHRTADAFDDSNAQPAALAVNYYTEVPQFTCARWAVDFPGLGPPAADDDADGAPNFMEYALGTNPQSADIAAAAQLVPDGAWLHFIWQLPAAALQAGYQPEWTDALAGPWSSAGMNSAIVADDGVTRTLRTTLPAGSVRRFVRLRVTMPP